jgi:hypothetical protein
MTKAPIAVIGTGSVGGTLGRAWVKAGHPVRFGSRQPDAQEVRLVINQLGPGVRAESPADAAAEAEIVVLAVPWHAAKAAVEACGDLAGKILVDCTNPLRPDLSGLEVGPDGSGAELVARWAPGARVVKAFNTTGFNIMAQPVLTGGTAMMPVCGDDADARARVCGLARDVGFEPLDAGPLREARLLEPMALLWIRLSLEHGLGRDWAFAIARR